MKQVEISHFGLLIAYILPGFVLLWGLSFHSPTIAGWLGTAGQTPPVSGFLYVMLASVGGGLLASTLRWLVVDRVHYRTGIPQRSWDYSVLPQTVAALEFLVANQYRYYQFYGNTFVAVLLASGAYVAASGKLSLSAAAIVVLVECVLWAGSRDTLRNYHNRAAAFLAKSTIANSASGSEATPVFQNSGADHLRAPGLIRYSRWVVIRKLFFPSTSEKLVIVSDRSSEPKTRN